MKIALLFSGQGAQYKGMGKELYENFEEARAVFEEANASLGFDLTNLIFEDEEELNKTENTQPAILTMSIAALEVLRSKGIDGEAVAGLSLGEYSALVASGALNFNEAVKLVKNRGRFMQEAVPSGKGAMSAVMGLSKEKLLAVCKMCQEFGVVEIANYNTSEQMVIGGEVEAISRAGELAKELGAKRVVPLTVSGPFHTSMLKRASERLSDELKNANFSKMNLPVVTNVRGNYIEDLTEIGELLEKQVMSSVLWVDTIDTLVKDGYDTFIEVGPGRVLSGFVKKYDRKLTTYNVEDLSSLEKVIENIQTRGA